MYLRQFSEHDAPEISSWFSSREESLLWGGRVFSWPIETAEIINRSHQKEIEFLTLSNGSDVLGFIELQHVSPDEMRLCRVAVSPKFRGQGMGKALVSLSLEEIKKRKQYQVVTLAVFTKNETAHKCYKSLGFVVVDKGPKFKEFSGERWPLVQMETAL
ncbi:TPA: GNAT family N-acetyltransferase [Vibrio parahaemolyticus]|nr:GNAT family N-acetyltransferase [Vibrio parahaemolyticus]MDF4395712.1 GNAT family N-acetyltransferase [Vibrio parahaemolyticus]HBC3375468.1 GNAT family N-acetyltransferase [Vibrio parahaemolyticus]HBH7862258.1 GNAT family N-acetyltransferase [Vibrio parahaemolyticus]HBH7904648.1 GNAT family N-acetyltransferase [Vibrio parahaemolyticus]